MAVLIYGPHGPEGPQGDPGATGSPGVTEYNYVFSRSGNAAVVTGTHRGPIPFNCTITAIMVMVGTAPTGASIIVDVNKNGVTVFTTQANRPTIAASANSSGVVTNMDVTSLAAGDYLTVDIDQVGSTVTGADISVVVVVQK